MARCMTWSGNDVHTPHGTAIQVTYSPSCAGRCGALVCDEELPDEAADSAAMAGREPLLLAGRELGEPVEVDTPASALAAACAATCRG
jgi:hypothetical protein